MKKKNLVFVLCVCVAGLYITHVFEGASERNIARAATVVLSAETKTLSAVDATPLDGTTSGQTYMSTDRVTNKDTGYVFLLDERTDAVEIMVYATNAQSVTDGDSVLLNIYTFSDNGPSLATYDACTFTFGTAVAPGSGLFADTAVGTDLHDKTVEVTDSGSNRIVRVWFDNVGRHLYIEPETFTGVTGCIVIVRRYGFVE